MYYKLAVLRKQKETHTNRLQITVSDCCNIDLKTKLLFQVLLQRITLKNFVLNANIVNQSKSTLSFYLQSYYFYFFHIPSSPPVNYAAAVFTFNKPIH